MSGQEKSSSNGVAIMVSKKVAKCVQSYLPISDRLIMITISAKPTKMHIIQVYMPTSDATDEEIEHMYNTIESISSKIPNKEPLILIGDFNAKVGKTEEDDHIRQVVGRHGLGQRNHRGERLIQFALENYFTIMNTTFKHHSRRLSTWTSPDSQYKNQIDYLLIRQRWRTSITSVKAKPGADCNSDHKLLKAHYTIKLQQRKYVAISKRITPPEPAIFQARLNSSLKPDVTEDPEQTWTAMKSWIKNAVGQPVSNNLNPHKHWMTDTTIQLVEQRRILKGNNLDPDTKEQQLRQLNRKIKSACRHDKNKQINDICDEIEQHANYSESRELFNKIKYLSKEFQPRTQIIQDEFGNTTTDPLEIVEVWKKYCLGLFGETASTSDNRVDLGDVIKEPAILRTEVQRAITRLKNNKAPGVDGITAEVLKTMGEAGIDLIHLLCKQIWDTGKWPDEWCNSIFIPIFKKGSPLDCSNYRTIALIPHASKIFLTIINERLKPFLLPQISDEQTGFIPGKGTREQILNLRQIIEKAREYNIEMYLCFVDYSKAFDKVKWNKLWTILLEMGTPPHLIYLVKQLYENNNAKIRANNTLSSGFKSNAGVRQGCILSPILFNIYSEYIMRRVIEEWNGGISVGGRRINNLRYADDTVIIAASKEELQEVMTALCSISAEYGLELNKRKTKTMIVDRLRNNQPDVRTVAGYEVVSQFNYLGSMIANSGGCEAEIRRRVAMARNATTKLTKIWKTSAITRRTKLRIANSLIFPIAMYGSETWTLKESDKQRINALEMWVYRRLLRIPWTAHRTNISIIEELKIETRLVTELNQSILRYIQNY